MFKTMISTAIMMTAAGTAFAQPLPAPPTEVYTPPVTSNCANQTLHVYFPAGTSALTPASKKTLKAAKAQLDGCILGQVSLNASAADARSEAELQSLTSARIEAVSSALAKYRLDGMHMQTDAEMTDEISAYRSPMDRKVEIRVAAWSPETS